MIIIYSNMYRTYAIPQKYNGNTAYNGSSMTLINKHMHVVQLIQDSDLMICDLTMVYSQWGFIILL